MEFEKISKLFMIAVVFSLAVLLSVFLCAKVFVFNVVTCAMVATIVAAVYLFVFIKLLKIDAFNEWLDR